MPRRRAPPKNPELESESEEEIEIESEEESESEEEIESEEIASDSSEEIVSDGEVEEPSPKPKKGKKAAPAKKAAPPAKKAAPPKGKAKSKAKKNDDAEDEDEEPGKRYFKILVDSIIGEDAPPVPIGKEKDELSSNGGRYTGKNPMQAAKKAFTRICRVAASGGECTYVFTIIETTQKSAKKEFTYIGVRKELDVPQKVQKGDTNYEIKFSSEVKSYKPEKDTLAKAAPSKKTPAKKAAPAKSGTKRGRNKAK